MRAAAEAGAGLIVMCDTNGGTMPEEIAELTRAAIARLPVPVGIHCHNDCELAVANSLAAVDAGAVQVQGTINGLGERCGNVDLISVIANLAIKKRGYEVLDGSAVEHLTELSRFVYETANMRLPSEPAVCRARARSRTRAACTCTPSTRVAASYEHIEPERVGNERRMLVSELSGRSNIKAADQRARTCSDDPRDDGSDSGAGRGVGEPGLPVRGGPRFVRPAGEEAAPARTGRTSSGSTFASTSRPTRPASVTTEATVKLRVGDADRGTKWPKGMAR